jgi:glycosyltransferase involved in cell wall biosynthesis
VLFVGGFEPHKNVTGLLDTFALVHAERPDLSLVIVGSRELPEPITRHAEALGLQRNVDVVFLVGLGEQLIDLYDGASAFVSLSWRETFGLPALEALSRGRPVVASAWGAAPEVIGEFGQIVDPRDTANAARAIIESATPDDEQIRERRCAWARRLSWAHTADLTLECYRQLIGQRSS